MRVPTTHTYARRRFSCNLHKTYLTNPLIYTVICHLHAGLYNLIALRCNILSKLIGVWDIHLALLEPEALLLLGGHVLDPDLLRMVLLKPADKDGVPQLAANTEVLAAAHQSVGFATFDGGRELVVGEEVVLALGLRDESEKKGQRLRFWRRKRCIWN